MSSAALLSRFTPSLMDPETLEAIFVKRQRLAALLVEHVREGAVGAGKHHALLVGPRGIGKTHLVSLVYHRAKADDATAERLRIAWLREEEWGVSSYLDFLLAVCRAVAEEHGAADLAERCAGLRGLGRKDAEVAAEQALLEYLGDHTLLVIAENLDEVFRAIGDDGQHKLRALVQNHPSFTWLATTPSLFSGVSLRTSPFYGFFEIHHLDELTFDEAVELLAKIAEHRGDHPLAERLRTATGRARIRALHHLAGGNPRAYVIFSQFLSCESLDELSGPVLQTLDDLTPYYQARLGRLSPQQRKIVGHLCDVRGAVTVKEIAQANSLTHQTASSQLKKLRELGYVRSEEVGRESFYELREPLMRLSLELKKTRGRPMTLLVSFLQLWYSREELIGLLERLAAGPMERECLLEAIGRPKVQSEHPAVVACERDFANSLAKGNLIAAMQIADELTALDFARGSLAKAACFEEQRRDRDALAVLDRALRSTPDDLPKLPLLVHRGICLLKLGRATEASACLENVMELLLRFGAPDNLQVGITILCDCLKEIVSAVPGKLADWLSRPEAVPFDLELGETEREGWATATVLLLVIPAIFDASINVATLQRWLAAWEEAASGRDDLSLPLRLLGAAIEYRENPDPRVLLRLPVEEREILRPLLPK